MSQMDALLSGEQSNKGKTVGCTMKPADAEKLDKLCGVLGVERAPFVRAAIMDAADTMAEQRGGWSSVMAESLPNEE